ncbi:MAG: GDP-mannose 4,6-dehydratase [Candidatus Nealsonbacteria bacterium]|nr:GDP-mannose 4,6-dehydratase [Candidatus Nealsonbacteria bacterium]
MKHSLVTGGAGFIGSHLTEVLLARGDRVSVVDDESTGSIDNLAAVIDHPNLNYTKDSVADEQIVRQMLTNVDEVYHMAAAVGVQLIAQSPIHTIETNIYPTELILRYLDEERAKGRTVKLFLASTSEVFGKNPKERWDEDDSLVYGPTTRGRWAYGTSKAIDEFLALAYWRERKLPVVVGRMYNVIGPRQKGAYGMVVPRFVDAALAGEPLVVHDDGQQVRCFAHVSDVVRAIVALMQPDVAIGQVFNIGSDYAVSILDLAKRVTAAVDPTLPIEFISYAEAYSEDFEDCRHRLPDLTRIRKTIDFQINYELDDIIREVIDWKRQQKKTEAEKNAS